MKAILLSIFLTLLINLVWGSEDAKRLYDDLMVDYNRLLRPGSNPREPLTIKFQLRLSQIIDLVSEASSFCVKPRVGSEG